jgi:haloalkane dehalogenase
MIHQNQPACLYASRYVDVCHQTRIHFIEAGAGDPILFLHGIPTSCYVWRHIIPYLSSLGRCVAPDLIGLGDSDKPAIEYTIFDHIDYIERFIDRLNLKKMTLVMHGWGSVIGFDYAMRHEHNCNGLVFYEAFLRSQRSGDFFNPDMALPFYDYVASWQGHIADLEINGTRFVDQTIAQGMIGRLTEKEMDQYRRPFQRAGTSKPILQYLKELPGGEASNAVDQLIDHYSRKLMRSNLPKLMLYSIPGLMMTIATVIWAKEQFPNLDLVEVGEELHFAQESYPQLMGASISAWLQSIEQLHRSEEAAEV